MSTIKTNRIEAAKNSKAKKPKSVAEQTPNTGQSTNRELVITRIISASPEKVFQAWTDPNLLKQWFAPRPWTTPVAELDVRPGGASLIVMRSPEGSEFPNRGVYLEVVKNERLVFTDAYTKAWEPSEKPFMTVIVTLEDLDGKTRYTARVLHWTVADRETHEKMGFHTGWAMCADQLEALVKLMGEPLPTGNPYSEYVLASILVRLGEYDEAGRYAADVSENGTTTTTLQIKEDQIFGPFGPLPALGRARPKTRS
jgi:uncharacterized protein YndB with AHSA1/START domain